MKYQNGHSEDSLITIEVAGSVATIWLDREERRNALNRAMCVQLSEALSRAAEDDDIKVVFVRAKGTVFCAGADLQERKLMNAEQIRERRMLAFSAYDTLETLPKPCVGVVEGAAIGAGAEIATACDFILATPTASFRYPEVAWGSVGATQRLPEIVGKRMAKELLFTGRVVTAHEAQRLGIVNQVVEAEHLAQVLEVLSSPMSSAPGKAISLTKRCVNQRFDAARSSALATEIDAIDELLAGPEWHGRFKEFGVRS